MATSLPLPLHPGVFDHLTSWLDAAFPLEAQAAAGVAPSSPFGSQTQAPAPALPPDGQTGPDLTAGSDPYAASPYEPTRLTPVPEPGFLQSALMNVLSQIPMMTPQPDRYGRMPHHFNRFAGIVGPLLAHGVAGGLESSIRARQADINAKNLVATQTAAANEKARIATISPSITARQSGINAQTAARAAIDAARIRAAATNPPAIPDWQQPPEVLKKILNVRKVEAKALAEGTAAGRPPAESKTPPGFQWTKAGAYRIPLVERELTSLRAKLYDMGYSPNDIESDARIREIINRRDTLIKNDISGQLKSAKTLKAATRITDMAEAYFPEVFADSSFRQIGIAKRNEFVTR